MIGITVGSFPPKYHVKNMTTITNSVTDNLIKIIDKEYFITRDQRMNLKRKSGSIMGGVGEEYHDVYRD